MPTDCDPLHLDERTARLGRELFAEVRQRRRDEDAVERQRRSQPDSDTSDGPDAFDWLFGDGDADGGDGD